MAVGAMSAGCTVFCRPGCRGLSGPWVAAARPAVSPGWISNPRNSESRQGCCRVRKGPKVANDRRIPIRSDYGSEGEYVPSEAEQLAKARLTERQTQCLSLHCYDGKSMAQIGEIMGISKAMVQQHIEAARHKLRKVGLKARILQREPGEVLTNMDMDRITPDEVRTLW